ncbi:MAG TPA: AAA family ATPase [Candidatus Binatus sp.]|nr:AAA family ATPase [Candidatus Binatus sp.]
MSRGNDRILVNCKGAGCTAETIVTAMGLSLADLFYQPRSNSNGTPPRVGLTLDAFAKAKGFTIDFLSQHGIHEDKSALVFRYLTLDGQKAVRQRLRLSLAGDKKFLWSKADGRPIPYGLWRLDEERKRGVREVILCEGESDALTFWLHNLAAIGVPGADMCSILAEPHVRGFSTIIICKEPDQGGETFVKGIAGRLAELRFAGTVKVVEYSKADVKDASDLHVRHVDKPGAFESEFSALSEMAQSVQLPFVGMVVRKLSAVAAEKVQWLWQERLPLGKLGLFAGDSGLGKSTVAYDLTARLSRGMDWPDGRRGCAAAASLILTAEDTASDTVRPRVEAAGGDLDLISVVDCVSAPSRDGALVERGFNLNTDLPMLEDNLKDRPDVRLVVIDPVSSYMGTTDSHKNSDVRVVLAPLAKLAEKHRCAIIMVTHLNKGEGSAQHRVTGSIAFVAAARASYLFAQDPEGDESAALFLPLKNNLASRGSGLRYRIVADSEGRQLVVWGGEVQATADEVLDEQAQGRKPKQRGEAADLLLNLLNGGPRWVVEVEQEASRRGIADRTLRRAREQLKIESFREGGKWLLKLPNYEAKGATST